MAESMHTESTHAGFTDAARRGGASTDNPEPVGGVRRVSGKTIPPLLMLYLGLGVVQIFLAGLGVFSLDGQQLGAADETAFAPHRFVAMVMAGVTLLIVIAAALARPGRRMVIMSVVLLLIVFVVQGLLASAGEDTSLFGGLHAIVGIASLGLAGRMLALAR